MVVVVVVVVLLPVDGESSDISRCNVDEVVVVVIFRLEDSGTFSSETSDEGGDDEEVGSGSKLIFPCDSKLWLDPFSMTVITELDVLVEYMLTLS